MDVRDAPYAGPTPQRRMEQKVIVAIMRDHDPAVLPRQEQLRVISFTLILHGSRGDCLMADFLKKGDDALRDVLIEIERRHAALCRKMRAERFETGINRRFVPLVIGEGRLNRFARDVIVRRSLIEVAMID